MSSVLITGASRGLGLEFTRQYAADGWDVIACCREPKKADKLQALAKDNKKIRIEPLDVSDFSAPAKLAEKLKGITLDILINNAGIYSGTDAKHDDSQTFGTLNAEAWNTVLRTNTIAPIMVTQAFAPLMAKKGAKIIMISSGMGSIEQAGEGVIAYRTSKAALNAAMHNIAMTLRPQHITVISFHPGWVKTDMGGSGADITPEQSVSGMRKTIVSLTEKQSGQFLRYSGEIIPW
jgi:NAD(P)-dependent dehydrogenase (short-subunit alcohol dehydrogenase family)